MARVTVHFGNPGYAPVEVEAHSPLADALVWHRTPIRFGCRGGVCATCIVSVESLGGLLAAPGQREAEVLEIFGDGDPTSRLACQVDVSCDIRVTRR